MRAGPPLCPRRRRIGVLLAVFVTLVTFGLTPTTATAATRVPVPLLRLTKVAGTTGTTALAVRSGDPAVYLAVQTGTVVALGPDGQTRTVLDLTGKVRAGGEQGLLGLTFDSAGAHLYVHYSGRAAGETVVEEYTVGPNVADPATGRVVLAQAQPQPNHNGGQLTFGPDGMLYLGLGDGGSAGDQGAGHAEGGNGQSLQTLLGKILRIDPRPSSSGAAGYTVPSDNPFVGRDGRDEIWVYGLRNPWRFSFDRKTDALWIADVGQNSVEEVDRLAVGRAAGANLGWNVFEGDQRYREGAITDPVAPIATLTHDKGNCSITGGYVYRGHAIPALRGWYLYTDYCEGTIHALRYGAKVGFASRTPG